MSSRSKRETKDRTVESKDTLIKRLEVDKEQ